MKYSALLILVVGMIVLVRTHAAEAPNADLAALNGTWLMVASEEDGQKMPAEDQKKLDIRLILKDGKYTRQTAGEVTEQGSFAVGAAGKLKSVDIVPADGPLKDKKIQGIYKLDQDTLVICYDQTGDSRPAKFETKAGSTLLLAAYSRSK